MSQRANILANRLLDGANQLIAFVGELSQAEWETICPAENRSIGVLVHHVASAYPVEVDLMKLLASGKAIEGVSWNMVDKMNADHAETNASCSKGETLDLLRKNSALAAFAIRQLSDKELDQVSPVSLNWETPLTTQYFIEDHPISHSYAHLASIQSTLNGKK